MSPSRFAPCQDGLRNPNGATLAGAAPGGVAAWAAGVADGWPDGGAADPGVAAGGFESASAAWGGQAIANADAMAIAARRRIVIERPGGGARSTG